MNKLITIAACLIATALLHAQTTIFVTPNGNGNGTTWATACNLENAVKTAVSGDQIWVQSGTHYPTKMLVVPASVKIYGGFAGTEDDLSQRNFVTNITIVDGQQKIGSIFRLENSAEISGFTIQNGNANNNPHKNGGGVWADDNAVIAHCIIQNNAAIANGGGIYAKGNLSLISSTVENNTANAGADLYGNCITQVSTPPVIITHPDVAVHATITPNGVFSSGFSALSVSATSTLPLSYQWFSNTVASNENGTNLGSAGGAQTATYWPQYLISDTSYYYCEISNSDGTTKSNVSGVHIVTERPIVATVCKEGPFDFGEVSFETPTEYTITGTVDGQSLTQVWSDAVTATNCQKTTYKGDSLNYNRVDCRSNPDYSGDLFSWCAVVRFADVLCPGDWRVPTKDDFINLDKALGGPGVNTYMFNATLGDKYIISWGSTYGGFCTSAGSLDYFESDAFYWSQSEHNSTDGYALYLSSGYIFPQWSYTKCYGYTLRCVK